MPQQELEKYLWGAATALRGTIDAGDYKQNIFPLMFFKRISDVYDEEFENALAESDNDLEFAAFTENHLRFRSWNVKRTNSIPSCSAALRIPASI